MIYRRRSLCVLDPDLDLPLIEILQPGWSDLSVEPLSFKGSRGKGVIFVSEIGGEYGL